MYCNTLHTQKQHTNVDRCGIINKVLEHKVVRQTTIETQKFIFRSQIHHRESYVSIDELVGVSLFQLDPLSWVSFNNFPDSTILIHSTKGARSCPHKLAAAHHNVGS